MIRHRLWHKRIHWPGHGPRYGGIHRLVQRVLHEVFLHNLPQNLLKMGKQVHRCIACNGTDHRVKSCRTRAAVEIRRLRKLVQPKELNPLKPETLNSGNHAKHPPLDSKAKKNL